MVIKRQSLQLPYLSVCKIESSSHKTMGIFVAKSMKINICSHHREFWKRFTKQIVSLLPCNGTRFFF